ncbi:TPA: hypothetical protein QC183_004664 [Bacillus cereus]|nr:hypothetical protein [Bacillus cereus]HDR8336449.1 hypothetical protein [Bacillus cereus]
MNQLHCVVSILQIYKHEQIGGINMTAEAGFIILKVRYDLYNGDKDTEVYSYLKMDNAIKEAKKRVKAYLDSYGYTEEDFNGPNDKYEVQENESGYKLYTYKDKEDNTFEVTVYKGEYVDAEDETINQIADELFIVTASYAKTGGYDKVESGIFKSLQAAHNFVIEQKKEFQDEFTFDGSLNEEVTNESYADANKNGTVYQYFTADKSNAAELSVNIRKSPIMDEPSTSFISQGQLASIQVLLEEVNKSKNPFNKELEKAIKKVYSQFGDVLKGIEE